MAVRYIHKGWKLFWKIVFSILFFVVLLVGLAFVILQLDATEDTIAQKIESSFNQNYQGRLVIGELDGTLPFSAVLNGVRLIADTDSTRPDTVISVEQIELGADLWMLLQNKLVINEFSLQEPSVRLLSNGADSYTLANALQPESPTPDTTQSSFIKDFEIIAPGVTITDGSLFIEEFFADTARVNLPEPLAVQSLNTTLFIELTGERRFLDIENFSAQLDGFETRQVTLSGQIFNDDEVLEFNAFNLGVGQSELHLNGQITGVNLYAGNIAEQLKNANYDIFVSSDRLVLEAFTQLLPEVPSVQEPLAFALEIEGALNTLNLQTFRLGIDESYFSIQGEIEDLFNEKEEVFYTFRIDTLEVYRDDIAQLIEQPDESLFQVLRNLNLTGFAEGDSDTLSLNIEGESPLGRFSFMGQTQLIEPYSFIGRLQGRNVNISPFLEGGIDTTLINVNAGVKGYSPSLTEGRIYFTGEIYDSRFAHIPIDSLQLTATLDEGLLNATYFYMQKNEVIEGEVTGNFNENQKALALNGNTQRLDLETLLENPPVDSTSINTSYSVDIEGFTAENISGTARFEVEPSIIGGDSVAAHYIEAALSPANQDIRSLTVNSSLFDMEVTGDLEPVNISQLFTYWKNYFDQHITREILLDSVSTAPAEQFASLEPVTLQGQIDFKNIDILKNYLPAFPSVTTDGIINFDVEAAASDLQFSTRLQSDTLIVSRINLKDADMQLSGRFQHDQMLKQFSNLELTANAARLESDLFDMDSLRMQFRFHEDSLFLSQQIEQFSDTASYNLEMYATLTDTAITAVIDDFFLGNYRYAWVERQNPAVTYTRSGAFIFDSFRFQNQEGYLALTGTLSPGAGDSLQVMLRDIDLGRISTLLREEINFDGELNATLITQSPRQNPAVQGQLNVNDLTIQNNFIGRLMLESNYNTQLERFDVQLTVESDSLSNSMTRDIFVEGYYNPDAAETGQDSTFYFEADFNELNMWALSLVLENLFVNVDGIATGSGYITGNAQNLEYHADLQLRDVFVKPVFMEPAWYLTGEVRLDSEEGVIINYVDVRDEDGGTGTLYGQVDLNAEPEPFVDLKLRLDELKFLSNNYEFGIAFYGNMAATGTIHLLGPVDDLEFFSVDDIFITRYSSFGLPLVESTELTEANQFIEFVDSFENPEQALLDNIQSTEENPEGDPLQDGEEELAFSDRVNIDFQFRAPQPITVTLLFDPSTGEKLTAEGTGNLRLIMEGGNVQLFGSFNVSGGTYYFTSGQIFQRELEIRPGGTIAWTGEPEEASVDIEAVYHARPDIGPLIAGINQDGFTRTIPVNLVIEINGTINSIQQNYYFELPDYVSAPRLQYRISQINANEEIKLFQATSILLSGEFLAVGPGGSRVGAFSGQLTQGSTFINPIISQQIVSPLLSNQINALLNSEVAEVDIDFQLNAYNEVNLGVALRLYNDRLIIQRQGRLTGQGDRNLIESLGNLSVAYRITPNLSVRAFHRQVPALGVFSNTQTADFQPSVEGIGLEAQIRFNTWQQLWLDIGDVLGVVDEEETEAPQNPVGVDENEITADDAEETTGEKNIP